MHLLPVASFFYCTTYHTLDEIGKNRSTSYTTARKMTQRARYEFGQVGADICTRVVSGTELSEKIRKAMLES